MSKPDSPRRRADSCPLCGQPVAADHAPFCSEGCRNRDLLHWLGDGYRLPGPTIGSDDEEGLDNHATPPL